MAPPTYDSLAREDRFKVESRAAYTQASRPKAEYKTYNGTKPINAESKAVKTTKEHITEEKWTNRSTRMSTTYNHYTTVVQSTPIVAYHDPYNTFFWLWLLDRSADERAVWAYNHRTDADSKRIDELRKKDAEFDARLKKLEGKPVDPNYTPTGLDGEDLMYTDDYVDAVYNPKAKPDTSDDDEPSGFLFVMGWVCVSTCLITFVVWVIWAVFFYDGF